MGQSNHFKKKYSLLDISDVQAVSFCNCDTLFLGTIKQLCKKSLLVFTGLLPLFSSWENMPEYLEAEFV